MNTNQHIDVLITGSGPTGLMAALLLHQSGLSIKIIDKNTQQTHESRAFAIHARSMELFLNAGIIDEFLAEGTLALGMQVFTNGKLAAEVNLNDIGTVDSPYSFILMLPQSQIEKILYDVLIKRGVVIEHDTELLTFTQNSENVTSILKNTKGLTETVVSSYLIGADGAHSTVRNGLNLSFIGDVYPQSFLLADCKIDWDLKYEFAKVFMKGPYLGLYLPLKGKELGRIIAIDTEKKSTFEKSVTLEEIATSFQKAANLPVKLSNPIWTTRYRIHHRSAEQYKVGRVFIAGDSAHIHSPAGGQGMNTGLQDAANLAWKIAMVIKGSAPTTLLGTYHQERWPVGQKLLHFTDRFFGSLATQQAVSTMLRNFIVPRFIKLITRFTRCRTAAFRFVSQLGIRYHMNSFLRDDISSRQKMLPKALSPGHRAPNALYKREHDVFGLLRGYQFHILILSKKALLTTEIDIILNQLETLPKVGLPIHTHFITHLLSGSYHRVIQAENNQIFTAYGITHQNPQAIFLIRPDGYIAYRSYEMNIEKLKQFLEIFLH